MLYACVRRFDVMDTVQNFLGTKQGLSPLTAVRGLQRPQLTPFSALQTGRLIVSKKCKLEDYRTLHFQ